MRLFVVASLAVFAVTPALAQTDQARLEQCIEKIDRDAEGDAIVQFEDKDTHQPVKVRTRMVLGADGARSEVARQAIEGGREVPFVYAYHEILRTPATAPAKYDGSRCDVYYCADD